MFNNSNNNTSSNPFFLRLLGTAVYLDKQNKFILPKQTTSEQLEAKIQKSTIVIGSEKERQSSPFRWLQLQERELKSARKLAHLKPKVVPKMSNVLLSSSEYRSQSLLQANNNNQQQQNKLEKTNNQLLTIEFKPQTSSTREKSQIQKEHQIDTTKTRKQVLAKQVERTFKRKILGKLILATSATILLFLLLIDAPLNVSCYQDTITESTFDDKHQANSSELSLNSNNNNNNNNNNSSAQVHKLKPVNFTLVDEIFESTLSESEVVKRWKFMDTQIQEGLRAILKMLFPQIVAISQDAKVSGDCSGGILKWILSLRNLRSWAIKMLDATGKPTSGMFEGSLTMFGNYKQCLSIRAPDEDEIEITDQFEEYFRGQYCVLHLKPWMPVKQSFYNLNSTIDSLLRKNYKYYEKTLYDELAEIAIAFNFIDIRLDLCVPSTCTVADIQRVAELLSKKVEMRAKVMRCDIASREKFNLFNLVDKSTFIWLIVPVILFSISILSTIAVIVNNILINDKKQKQKESASIGIPKNNLFIDILQCLSIQKNLCQLFRQPKCCNISSKNSSGSMSLNSNLNRVINPQLVFPSFPSSKQLVQQESGSVSNSSWEQEIVVNNLKPEDLIDSNLLKPLPIYGVRNIFVIWFIIIQLTVELKYQYLRESLPLREMIISYWPMQIIVNSSLLFESIILITAFSFSYTCLESTTKNLIKFIIDKYLRLILSIVTLVALTIVTPLLAIESPIWKNFIEQQSNVCKSTGYLNLFFLQNFISYDKICLPHTWLFSIEMQLVILSIPLMVLVKQFYCKLEDSMISKSLDLHKKNSIKRKVVTSIISSKLGILHILLIVVGALVNFSLVFYKQLPPSWFYTFPDITQKNHYFSEYLTKTWTHLSVFLMGLLAGYICRAIKQIEIQLKQPSDNHLRSSSNITIDNSSPESGSTRTIMAAEQHIEMQEANSQSNDSRRHSSSTESENDDSKDGNKTRSFKIPEIPYKSASLICMFAIIFSTFFWSTGVLPSPLVAALYDSLSRLIWSFALAYLLAQLCLDSDRNNCSLITRIFCHPICTILGRLSFLVYLISPYVNNFILALQEQALFPSIYMIFHFIIGNIVIIYTIAIILSISIEQPLRRLVSRFILSLI